MKKIVLLFSLLALVLQDIQAQDQHFTQFYAAPLTLNPALTGAYDGRYRFSGIYRDQWRTVLDKPYVTFAGMLDVRFPLDFLSRQYKDAVAIGLLFSNDKITGLDFNTNQIALSASYHKALDRKGKQYLSLGFQGGLYQRNVNYELFTFEDQFNGTNGYFDPTGEEFPENNFSYSDYSVGLNYAFTPKRLTSLFVGLAMHHIFEPQMTFYPTDTPDLYEGSVLFRKYSAQLSGSFPLSSKVALLPRVIGALQGPHLEMNAGTNVRILIDEYSGTALHLGTWVRPVGNYEDNISVDAVIGMLGIEYKNVLFGLSYDANLTDLSTTRTGQGAIEVSIAYLGNYENVSVICPKF